MLVKKLLSRTDIKRDEAKLHFELYNTCRGLRSVIPSTAKKTRASTCTPARALARHRKATVVHPACRSLPTQTVDRAPAAHKWKHPVENDNEWITPSAKEKQTSSSTPPAHRRRRSRSWPLRRTPSLRSARIIRGSRKTRRVGKLADASIGVVLRYIHLADA